jgi:hypothetical protein
MRRAMQDAGNIDEWCEIMKKGNNGGYANAWLLGDVNTHEIARLELGLMHVGFERTRDGFFTGSNVAENLKILRREMNTAISLTVLMTYRPSGETWDSKPKAPSPLSKSFQEMMSLGGSVICSRTWAIT